MLSSYNVTTVMLSCILILIIMLEFDVIYVYGINVVITNPEDM
jgi:hypothetical protein